MLLRAQIESQRKQLDMQAKQLDAMRLALEEQAKILNRILPLAQAAPERRASLVEAVNTAPASPRIPAASPSAAQLPAPPPKPPQPAQVRPEQAGPSVIAAAPLTIHIGDTATITPVGFMDLTNTFRSTNSGASLASNFGSIPYNTTIGGRLTEDKLSAQNSRIGFRVDAMYRNWHVLGYYEGDFVGGVAGSNTQVSSYSMLYRLRLFWADVRKGPFEMLAGQSWSMMTPSRRWISALPGDLFYGQEFDVNYLNGLTWGRIPGIRFLYHGKGDKITAGISLENSDQYFGGSGGGGVPTLPAALTGLATSEVDANQANGISLPNVHPDIIGKIAFDPNSHVHFEFGGVASTVKIFNPNTKQYFTKTGGGGFLNGNFEVVKNVRLITNNYWSDGAGRYIFGQAPNFIIEANGSPSLVHSGSTVDGLEATVRKSLFYLYYGGVYIGRNTALDLNGSPVGYGYSGSPNSQNRTIQEGTVGWNYTLWRDSRYGSLSTFLQYAYFFRNPWYVAPGAPRNAFQHAAWFDLRYTLPGAAPSIKY